MIKSAPADFRPKHLLELTAEASELSAKADFEARALIDKDADIQNRVSGSTFGGK